MIALVAASASSCLDDNPRFRVGWATFFVEFYDYVVDRFGVVQRAYCADNLVFTGDIDTACRQLPMVWSFGMTAPVTCTYRDAAGVRWTYEDLYYFWPGYIQEPPCFGVYDAPADAIDRDRTRDSTLERNGEGQVLISDEITLSEEQTDLAVLRADLASAADVVTPASLPEDTLEEDGIRTSDTELGDPPPEANGLPNTSP